jgi:hypothetical protein
MARYEERLHRSDEAAMRWQRDGAGHLIHLLACGLHVFMQALSHCLELQQLQACIATLLLPAVCRQLEVRHLI